MRVMSATHSLEQLPVAPEDRAQLEQVLLLTQQLLRADAAFLYIAQSKQLRLAASTGTHPLPLTLQTGEQLPGQVWESAVSLSSNQLWLEAIGTLCAPLMLDSGVCGVLGVSYHTGNADPASLPLLERFASLALMAVQHGLFSGSLRSQEHAHVAAVEHLEVSSAKLKLFELALMSANEAILITEVGRDGDIWTDAEARIVYANDAFERLMGFAPSRIIAQHPSILGGAETNLEARRDLRRKIKRGEAPEIEVLETRGDGSTIWVELSVVPLLSASGTVTHRISTRRDITEFKRSLLLESDRNRVLELLVGGATLTQTFEALSVLLHNQFPDAKALLFLRSDDSLSVAHGIDLNLETKGVLTGLKLEFGNGSAAFSVWQGVPVVTEDVQSDPVWARLSRFAASQGVKSAWATPIIQNDDSAALGALELHFKSSKRATGADLERFGNVAKLAAAVIERTQLAERLERQSTRDALTGLANRFALEISLEKSLKEYQGRGTQMALLQIDLDGFRQFNDTLGHAVGDELLVAVAERWLPLLPSKDVLARMGGDEFGLIVHHLDNATEAATLAKQLLEAIQRPFELRGLELFLGASIGFAMYPEDGQDAATLIRHANTAMNVVKRQGKNDAQRFRPQMNTAAIERLELEVALRRALERDELEVYYQPQVNNAGVVISVEALTYWNHPTQGLVGPSRFIPIAEESGLIVPLGAWVLAKSCAQIYRWRREGINVSLAVNMNVQQFLRSDFADVVAKTLKATGLEARFLELELTESALMHDLTLAVERLMALRRLGVRVSIDDFGTGYSSLSYLQKLPVNAVKIDRSFVSHLEPNAPGWNMVNLIVMLARHLRLGVVAEGVETSAQFEVLRDLAVDRSQGYLFSRPSPAEQLYPRLRGGYPVTN